MRLGQLSRKLQVKTADIIEVLQTKFEVSISNHPNSKVPDELISQLESYFTVEPIQPMPVEESTSPTSLTESLTEDQPTEIEEPSSSKDLKPEAEEVTEQPEELAPMETETTEEETLNEEEELNIVDGVIKAPKIEVAGIKVVGKIDLPEKKVELEETAESNDEVSISSEEQNTDSPDKPIGESESENNQTKETPSPAQRKKEVTPKPSQRKKKSKRPEKIVLTPEEERRIKLKEAQKQKLAAQKAKKEKRRETYSQEVKSTKPTSSVQKKKKKTEQRKSAPKKKKPTSLWGKFLYWLND